ncbi:MAG: VCBS repeat-containing protein [Verrucomicrobia bacterium]|nr:VCBS repeat-containing protein [Verrucomicrobiota bacterium]
MSDPGIPSTPASVALPPSKSPAKPLLSPRRRRLRWTLGILSGVLALGIGVGAVWFLTTRPQQYRPDERPEDITSSLSQGIPAEAPKPNIVDVTRQAGLASFRTFVGQRTSQLPEDMGSGAAWGDFDNDGDDDLFLVSQGGGMSLPREQWAPCELHENLGDGTFRKVADFPETRILGLGAAWGDCDGDGWLDLVVTGYNALLLFHNEAAERGRKLVRDARLPNLKGYWSGASWGDFDNDRDLDLYVCGYVQYVENEVDIARGETQHGVFVPFTLNPNSYPGGLNALFRNNGDGTFTDVAPRLKVTNPEGRSLGALWHDLDDDGWLDLYVANDVSDNVFYYNRGGTFEDLSHPALLADYRSAMGLAVGDYNRDGDDDLFISHWVAQENALYDNLLTDFSKKSAAAADVSGKVSERVSGSLTANVAPAGSPTHPLTRSPTHESPGPSSLASPLPVNPTKSPLRFMDIADMRGLGQIALQFVGWGTEFVDLDADGWLDLVVANGNTLEFEGPIPRKLKPQEAFLFWNQRGEHFYNLAPLNKSLSEQHVTRGLAVSDYDNDGDMDVLFVHHGEGAQLFRNDMQTGHWLKLRLRSRLKDGRPLGFGDGSKVIARVGGAILRRAVSSVSYLSQSSRTLHFGLGSATKVDQLEVRWHAGGTNFFSNLDANATWEITEGEPTPRRVGVASSKGPERHTTENRPPPTAVLNEQGRVAAAPGEKLDKARLLNFWNNQRAGMNALKIDKDSAKAIPFFRAALELDPKHEDSRYYLAHCLAAQGDATGALVQLEELQRINSHSHRGFQQWGSLRAIFAKSDADLAAAEQALERAHAINPEETGALLVLGEVSLLRGDLAKADERLAAACRTNPKAVGGFFLRGYLAWKRGDDTQARKFLEDTRTALGKDWQPKGATSEGDVQQKQHIETTPLTRFWEQWDGLAEPEKTFAQLDAFLTTKR